MVMDDAERVHLEQTIKEHHQRYAFVEATKIAIAGYGREIYGYLLGVLRTRDAAAEVFLAFCNNVEAGFPSFEWRSTFRTWAYTIARRALCRFNETVRRQRRRLLPLSETHTEMLGQASRTPTHEWLKSSVRRAFQDLRRQLPEEDQTILILRLDRDLSWEEVALVTGDFENEPHDDALKREIVRVKTRFSRAKDQLKHLGLKLGLVKTKK